MPSVDSWPDPFLPELPQQEEKKHYEVKGVSLSMEEIETIQRGARLIVEQYGSGYTTWDQVLMAVSLYQRMEVLKPYAKPVE